MQYAEKMATSTDPVDKRFMNLYLYRKASQHNIRFGFENDLFLSHNRHNGATSEQHDESFNPSPDPLAMIDQPSLSMIAETELQAMNDKSAPRSFENAKYT